jgi:hypothetical protein
MAGELAVANTDLLVWGEKGGVGAGARGVDPLEPLLAPAGVAKGVLWLDMLADCRTAD